MGETQFLRAGNAYYGAGGRKAVKAFFANYANFSGRSTRREYWWAIGTLLLSGLVLIGGLLLIVFGSLSNLLRGDSGNLHGIRIVALILLPLVGLVGLPVCLCPWLALTVRRARDAGVHWGVIAGLLVTLGLASWTWAWAAGALLAGVSSGAWLALVVIACLPSRPLPEQPPLAGWPIWLLTFLQVGLGALGLIIFVVVLLKRATFLVLPAYLLWMIGAQVVSRQRVAANRQRLAQLWALADQLGYGPEDLKRIAGQYGRLDWAATRPENLQFVPSTAVQLAVIAELQKAVAAGKIAA
ncbi:MAG: DUF805 domain-containing protein [Lactobacillus sp.]|jgi:uncharacterized membrane protein YhaH (DUF805 family)|nr:DUF805 domain-containing protein [Lactobacillus sp.]MCI2033186.1 DUF805 domain-containing protein [Lactobacillus sp.]